MGDRETTHEYRRVSINEEKSISVVIPSQASNQIWEEAQLFISPFLLFGSYSSQLYHHVRNSKSSYSSYFHRIVSSCVISFFLIALCCWYTNFIGFLFASLAHTQSSLLPILVLFHSKTEEEGEEK